MDDSKIKNVIIKEANNSHIYKLWQSIRQSFREFLKVPTFIIVGFLLVSVVGNYIDHENFVWLNGLKDFLKKTIFNDPKATSALMETIAGSIITVSSLSVTLLLIVVQQTASAMSTEVFDQFLRSRHNQTYFGFFIGLSLYSLIVLATVNNNFSPVFSASLAMVFIAVALFLLIILIYTTINDMRPVTIINSIYDLTVKARKKQLLMVRKTRRDAIYKGPCKTTIEIKEHGYITHINVDRIYEATKKAKAEVEVVLKVSIGEYVTYKDVIAFVTSENFSDGETVGNVVSKSIKIEKKNDIGSDPFGGIVEMETIGWTSISTAKSNPAPGVITIRTFCNLLLRWSDINVEPDKNVYPIVYEDNVVPRLMDGFTTLTVAASESMQHQNFIEILHAFTTAFCQLNPQNKLRAEDIIMRLLSAMGEFVLTAPLENELNKLIEILFAAGRIETANAVEAAKNKLKQSIGKLNSRATRVQ
ncbi:MAG: DUF2254 family protein [Ginsengibacter sp.]